ncbi:MAG: TolC family protein [Acidobacteriota bacterium]
MKSILLMLLWTLTVGICASAQPPSPSPNQIVRQITVTDAVDIFLRQNLQLVSGRYDIDTAEAEKLTARLRPNPEVTVESSGLPLRFNGPLLLQQTFDYSISQEFELGGKRKKRITAAAANAELARSMFEIAIWQLTNDVKRKFYTVLLDRSLLDLARDNQKTFDEIVQHTRDVFRSGEISGLDFQRLEVERITFDAAVATAERDYELALRDLRLSLGGDYRAMEIDVAGAMEYYKEYDLSFGDLRDKALAARPDLKAAQLTERAADSNIALQNAQKIPNLTLSGGISQVLAGGSNYTFGVGIALPVSDRNQGERAKALIDKQRAQNQELIITNQILSDVEKAFIAVNIQKRRVDLYKTGILTKVADIQTATEFALKAGENSTLELLDAIRTRRDTLAAFYQAIFDYQSALLDLELATATTLPQ